MNNGPFAALVDPRSTLPRSPVPGRIYRPLDEPEEPKRDEAAASAKAAAAPAPTARAPVPPPTRPAPLAALVRPDYVPRFGSAPWKIVNHLRLNPRIGLTRAQIAEKFMVHIRSVDTTLLASVQAGLLKVTAGKNDAPQEWSAGTNEAPLPEAAKTKPRADAGGKPRPKKPAEKQTEAAAPPPFNAAIWLDGRLVVYGAQQMPDGGMVIAGEDLARLKRLVAWSAP